MNPPNKTFVPIELLSFANVRQLEVLEKVNEMGGILPAANALGLCRGTVQEMVRNVRRKASIQGVSPEHGMTHAVPDTHIAKGVSTYYNKEGKVSAQWVKSTLKDGAMEEMIRSMVEVMTEDVRGKSPDIRTPAIVNADLMVVYPMGDPHFGLYAWGKETGDDFDLNIAERLLHASIDNLVASAPPAETGLLLNLGDFFHMDNQSNLTKSGHQLDADSRWSKVMQVGLGAMIYAVTKLLEKHKRVIVRNVKGNHDGHSSFALSLGMDAYFSNNDRVFVDLSPAEFWFHRFGLVLIGSTHGDQCKKEALPGVMACDRAEDWGVTRFRYFFVGHVHHDEIKEFPGVTVESFRTLAAKDAWHAGKGYRSGRDMRCIILHKQYGEIGRYRCDISMITEASNQSTMAQAA